MKKGSIMSVSSPRLVSMAIGEKVDLEELGGWRLHAEQTGLIDQFVDTDEEAMAMVRRFLSYMPSHNGEQPPVAPVTEGSGEAQERILEILPEKRTQVYNMKKIIEVIVDRDSFLEIKPRFGRPAIAGLARLNGQVGRYHRQQPCRRWRRAIRGCMPQEHRLHGAVRQFQHTSCSHHRYARLRGRP